MSEHGMRIFRRIATLFIVIIAGCDSSIEPETTPIVRPVRYQDVSVHSGARQRTFSGKAKASLETTVSFRVDGTVVQRPVKVGDRIAAGGLIAELDRIDYQVAMQEAEARLASARAEARNARANYERVMGLYEHENASKSDLDAARAGAESGRAKVRSVRKQLESTQLQLSYTRLSAPAQCSVASLYVKVNENVSAGQSVATLNCGDHPEVTVAVPGMFIGSVRKEDTVAVRFAAIAEKRYEAIVSEVGVASDGAATTFPVTAVIKDPDPVIRSGMAADVTFRASAGHDRIVVPGVAVGEDREGRFVFVLEKAEGGKFVARRRPVEIGDLVPGGIVVRAGLSAGDKIVTAGVRRISDGQLVRLLDETAR